MQGPPVCSSSMVSGTAMREGDAVTGWGAGAVPLKMESWRQSSAYDCMGLKLGMLWLTAGDAVVCSCCLGEAFATACQGIT